MWTNQFRIKHRFLKERLWTLVLRESTGGQGNNTKNQTNGILWNRNGFREQEILRSIWTIPNLGVKLNWVLDSSYESLKLSDPLFQQCIKNLIFICEFSSEEQRQSTSLKKSANISFKWLSVWAKFEPRKCFKRTVFFISEDLISIESVFLFKVMLVLEPNLPFRKRNCFHKQYKRRHSKRSQHYKAKTRRNTRCLQRCPGDKATKLHSRRDLLEEASTRRTRWVSESPSPQWTWHSLDMAVSLFEEESQSFRTLLWFPKRPLPFRNFDKYFGRAEILSWNILRRSRHSYGSRQ